MKKHFWKLEYSITILVFLGLLLLFIPFNFENYLQAQMTNSWVKQYGRLSYIFSAIKAEELENPTTKTSSSQSPKTLQELVKPYLSLEKIVNKKIKKYHPRFLNGTRVLPNDDYFFDNFYCSNRGTFFGIKYTPEHRKSKSILMIMIDINGILPPNVWGKDIYGIDVYAEGEIRAFGHKKSIETMNNDCSKKGTGIYCSALYLIGGEMNE